MIVLQFLFCPLEGRLIILFLFFSHNCLFKVRKSVLLQSAPTFPVNAGYWNPIYLLVVETDYVTVAWS